MKNLLITILLASVVFVGCTRGLGNPRLTLASNGVDICFDDVCVNQVTGIRKLNTHVQDQIDQLKEHLGVVEYTEVGEWENLMRLCDEPEGNFQKCEQTLYKEEKIYLTSDPLKVEWVELECDNIPRAVSGNSREALEYKSKIIIKKQSRCQELKELIE